MLRALHGLTMLENPVSRAELLNALLAELVKLENSSDLVITHPAPSFVADQLCSAVIQWWGKEFLDEPPSEVVIENGIVDASRHLQELFELSEAEARSASVSFVGQLSRDRTRNEVAILISHQGPREIAHGAYYCNYLALGSYYDEGYLNWRAGIQAKLRSAY
ncbi:hypothetical protein [Uliginosibacterium gangwonense]|uniref:hypothetical protein n=1 Tax=Uliginosibacterium gangwonense TaxID=392736 RepID=UPI0012FA3BEF|nr:hypothetical protein [Uliginosibacterium gangwonense]